MLPRSPRSPVPVPPFAVPPSPAAVPAPRGAEDILREAEAYPPGIDLLTSASLETAAIAFGVHPDVVADARELLTRRATGP
jgi:hypothetical protein